MAERGIQLKRLKHVTDTKEVRAKRSSVGAAALAFAVAAVLGVPNAIGGQAQNPPTMMAPPTISGNAVVSQTLTASAGSWTGKLLKYSTHWMRCDSSGGSCSSIAGASDATYIARSADVSSSLRVNVIAFNRYGTVSATSAATSPVIDLSVTPPPVVSADTQPPTSPLSLTVASTATAITLTWSPATDNVGVAGYDVYVAGTSAAKQAGTTYTVISLTCGTAYSFAVDAFDAAGNTSSRTTLSTSTSACPPPPPPSSTCDGVQVATTSDLQAAISANPGGTKLCLAAGVHRLSQALTLKSSDTLSGLPGAILDGAKDITSRFAASGTRWVASGQTQNLTAATGVPCKTGVSLCQQSDDVFLDGRPLTRVGSLADVGPKTFYFDHANSQIWIGDNPSGHEVDATIADRAINGWGTGVDNAKIEGVIVEHFASQGIQCRDTWTIDNSEIRYNHGDGLQDCATVTNSNLHDNGKDGYVFGGQIGTSNGPYVFDHNSVTGNNYAGYDPNYEAGGAKFMQMAHLTVSNNYVANNDGPGLWTDWGNQYITYSGNDVEHNTGPGIFHEASYDAVIANNTIVGNGTDGGSSTLDSAGIMMNDSSNVQIYGNNLTGNHNAIGLTQTDRGSTVLGPLVTQNDSIHDNTITSSGDTGLVQWVTDGSYYTSRNNHFQGNHYTIGCDSTPFVWQDPNNASSYAAVTKAQWVAAGSDTSGQFASSC